MNWNPRPATVELLNRAMEQDRSLTLTLPLPTLWALE